MTYNWLTQSAWASEIESWDFNPDPSYFKSGAYAIIPWVYQRERRRVTFGRQYNDGGYKGLKGKDHGLTALLLVNRGIGGRRSPVSFWEDSVPRCDTTSCKPSPWDARCPICSPVLSQLSRAVSAQGHTPLTVKEGSVDETAQPSPV